MSIPAGPFIRVHMFFRIQDEEAQTTLWFKPFQSFPENFDIKAYAQEVYDTLAQAMQPVMSNTCTIRGAVVYVNNGVYTASRTVTTVYPGTVAQDSLPGQDSIVIRLHTETGGKKGRGRIFLPGVPETFVTESRVNATGATALDAFINQLVLFEEVEVVPPVKWQLYSRKDSAFREVTYADFNPVVCRQIGRRPEF